MIPFEFESVLKFKKYMDPKGFATLKLTKKGSVFKDFLIFPISPESSLSSAPLFRYLWVKHDGSWIF